MPRIGRYLYHEAMEKILSQTGCKYRTINLGNILVQKKGRRLYVNVAGKNLPYTNRSFPWETHIRPRRLDDIEYSAREYDAEPWMAFCYYVLENSYRKDFSPLISIDKQYFGAKFITVKDYRANMQSRSPSWGEVDLPREKVLHLTLDPHNI